MATGHNLGAPGSRRSARSLWLGASWPRPRVGDAGAIGEAWEWEAQEERGSPRTCLRERAAVTTVEAAGRARLLKSVYARRAGIPGPGG